MKVRGVGAAKNEAANLRRPHKLKKNQVFCEPAHTERSHSIPSCRHRNPRNGGDPMRTTKMPDWVQGQKAHHAISILTVAVVVLALLMVAKIRTVGSTEATGNPAQSTVSIYA